MLLLELPLLTPGELLLGERVAFFQFLLWLLSLDGKFLGKNRLVRVPFRLQDPLDLADPCMLLQRFLLLPLKISQLSLELINLGLLFKKRKQYLVVLAHSLLNPNGLS